MRWDDERYVRLYTRDTTDWLALSWQAQGLFVLILRKVNRAGVIDLGRAGKRGLAAHVGGAAASAAALRAGRTGGLRGLLGELFGSFRMIYPPLRHFCFILAELACTVGAITP